MSSSTIYAASQFWRGTERRHAVTDLDPGDLPIGPAGPPRFKIKAAESEERRGRINRLLKNRYAWRGYQEVRLPSDPSVQRFTLSALQDEAVIGTLTVAFDGDQLLGADASFGGELRAMRLRGCRLCEFTKLAVDPHGGSQRVLAALFHVAYIVAHRLRAFDTLLMEVNPRHRRYYERMLGCQALGSERNNTSVNAPAVLLGAPFAHIGQQIALYGGQPDLAARERSLYPFAFSATQESAIIAKMQARQRLVARRLTDTGHPDAVPSELSSADLLAT